jgi:hypothetical protein
MPAACNRPLGSKPWWISEDQYDQCHCSRTDEHDEVDCYCGQHGDDRDDAIARYRAARSA